PGLSERQWWRGVIRHHVPRRGVWIRRGLCAHSAVGAGRRVEMRKPPAGREVIVTLAKVEAISLIGLERAWLQPCRKRLRFGDGFSHRGISLSATNCDLPQGLKPDRSPLVTARLKLRRPFKAVTATQKLL